ncbi:hypothetical protein FXB39_20390 [Nocardioides sp. BGMRC 2183]|nr:hypothetical protein FXB39_20390 [Nocardioides sp. BGMRC 2183]
MSLTSPTAHAWSYRGGDWYAVFGDNVSVLLPPVQKDTVVSIWALVDGGADFNEILDVLLASGLSRLPGFALVSGGPGPTRLLLRGAEVTATVVADGETVELDGVAGGTWVERSFADPEALSIRLSTAEAADPPASGEDYPILTGLVRAGRIDRPALSSVAAPLDEAPVVAAPVDEAPVVAAPVDEVDAGPVTEMMDAVEEQPVGAPAADPLSDPLPDPLSDPLPDLDAEHSAADDAETPEDWVTPWGLPPGPPPPAPPSPPAPPMPAVPDIPSVPPATDDGDALGDDTQPPGEQPPPPLADQADADESSPADDVPPPPLGIGAWESIGEPANDHDGQTNAEAALTPDAARSGQPVAKLLVSDGQNVLVDRVVLIGRAPEARRFTSSEQPQLITVPSRQHEISSTHVEVRPGTGADHGTAVVTDMGSTNGTVLVQPGLGPEDLKPGIAVQLIPGAIIDLGDGITIQVSRP